MRAWTFNRRGLASEVLKLQQDLPQPQKADLKPHEVLVKVSHVSLFAPNLQLMAVLPHINSNPWIPESQFSGEIIALEAAADTTSGGLDTLKVGDKVFGMINPKKGGYNGSLAEYIVAPRESVVRKPSNTEMDAASGLGGGGCTVIGVAEKSGLIEVVVNQGKPSIKNKANGKRILVTGGSTGTGQFMVQLAKLLVGSDGKVVTTASPRNTEFVQKLGADEVSVNSEFEVKKANIDAEEVIDYTALPDLHTYLAEHYSSPDRDFDVIVDITGSDPLLYPKCPAYLKENGYFVILGNMARTHAKPSPGIFGALSWIVNTACMVLSWQINALWPLTLGGVPRKSFFHSGTPSQRNLELVRQLAEGNFRSVVDSTWKMSDLLKAYDHLSEAKISGKVVVDVQA